MLLNDDFSHSAAPKSPVFCIIMPLSWCIHAWIVRHNGLSECVNVWEFLPMIKVTTHLEKHPSSSVVGRQK